MKPVKQSDQTKYMHLYEPVSRKISNYCRLLTQNNTEAEDLLHDTILASYKSFHRLKSEEAFPAFLFSTAYQIYCKQLRRKKFRGNYNEQAATYIQDINADPQTKAELSLVLEKMKTLPQKQYEAMMLYHVADLPMEEIMKIQEISLSTVKQRLKYGRRNLLRMLNENERRVAIIML